MIFYQWINITTVQARDGPNINAYISCRIADIQPMSNQLPDIRSNIHPAGLNTQFNIRPVTELDIRPDTGYERNSEYPVYSLLSVTVLTTGRIDFYHHIIKL